MTIDPRSAALSSQDQTLPAHVIEIVGADALAFAQAQFSSDVDALIDHQWQWSTWLSAHGRVRAFFHLLRDSEQTLRMVLRGTRAQDVRAALSRFVLRSKVQLRAHDAISAHVGPRTEHNAEHAQALATHRIIQGNGQSLLALPGDGACWLQLDDSQSPTASNPSQTAVNANLLDDIRAGIPTLDPSLEDKLLPQWLGLDALGAISTQKGCYPGQEIVARLHFKGGNKRWLHRVAFRASELPAPGSELSVSGAESGIIVCAAWVEPQHGVALACLPATGDAATLRSVDTSLQVLSVERV